MKFNLKKLNAGDFDKVNRLQVLEQAIALLIIEDYTSKMPNNRLTVELGTPEENLHLSEKFESLGFRTSVYGNGYSLYIIW